MTFAVAVMFTCLALTSCLKDDDREALHQSKWVDLDLPSGLLWAKCNVGASTPESHGDLFAWGETETKDSYMWATYNYSNSSGELTKYCSRPMYGRFHFTDQLTVLEPDDDAATARLGRWARIPTKEEWQELIDNTTATWTTQNGAKGYLLTAENGKSLFLPAAGFCSDRTIDEDGIGCNYWSSSLETSYPTNAFYIDFNAEHFDLSYASRYYGFSVRAVKDTQ